MARRSLSRCSFSLNPRRSSRLKEIYALVEPESAKENDTNARALSPDQSSSELPKEMGNAVDTIDTGVTLNDLLSRRKVKKRKALVDVEEQKNVVLLVEEDGVDLEETISSLKAKKAKSFLTSAKLNKIALKETSCNEILVGSEFGLWHNKEKVDGKMKEFGEQSPLSVGCPTTFSIKKETIETCLDGSDDENAMMNSSAVFINKCDFDNEYFGEVVDKVSEREDLEQPDNVTSNIMDIFPIDVRKQIEHDFSSSSATRLENCQITSPVVDNFKKEHLAVCSTKCESADSNLVRNLPTDEVPLKDTQQELQFEESMMFDIGDAHLITAENPAEFVESDSKKSTFSGNDSWLIENRKNGFSDIPFNFNNRLVSSVCEFNTTWSCDYLAGPTDDSTISLSLENHDNFVDGVNFGSIDKNNCSGAIHNHKSLDIGSDGKYNMANENCCELESQSIQTLSTCSLSQMDLSILSSDTLIPHDDPCSITEAGSPYVNSVLDVREASYYDGDSLDGLMAKDYLLDYNGSEAQTEKLLLSSQVHILNKCSEGRPCAKISNLTDAVRTSGQIVCHSPVSQLHEIDGISKSVSTMETNADIPANSSVESSTPICVEHSPRKLLSNRKEISPNSQEKLLRALNNGGLDDVVKLSNCMKKLCFDKGAPKKPFEDTLFETERLIKKPKTMNQSLPEVTKGIPKSPDTICCNPCCLKNSSIHAQNQDAILFSQRQMQDTENIATKLLKGLNSLKRIVEETILSEGRTSPSKLNFDEFRLATKHASKLEVTTKKWLAMMAKDCTRFCKIMRLAENKLASPSNDLHKGRKKITFADEAGGALCQIKVYEQQPVAFIFPKS